MRYRSPNALWEPDFKRLPTVLTLDGEPDRVPFLDFSHDPLIMHQVLGREMPGDRDGACRFRVDFAAVCGYDVIRASVKDYHFPGPQNRIAEDTAQVSRGRRGWRDRLWTMGIVFRHIHALTVGSTAPWRELQLHSMAG